MKRISLMLLSTFVLSVISFSFAFAELSLEVSVENKTINISGNTGSDLPYENVTVYVTRPGGEASNVVDTDTLKENLCYYNQINSASDGSFSEHCFLVHRAVSAVGF